MVDKTLAKRTTYAATRNRFRQQPSSLERSSSPWFSAKVAEFGVALSDFGRDEAEEVIILTRNTREPLNGSRKVYREPINYSDTGPAAVHPDLKQVWGRSLGYRLMSMESAILVTVLQGLAHEGIPALGLHDGLMVGRLNANRAQEVMLEVGRTTTGITIPISQKLIAE
jgi:hypothetical protein